MLRQLPTGYVDHDGRLYRRTGQIVTSGNTAPPNGLTVYLLHGPSGTVYGPGQDYHGPSGPAFTDFEVVEPHHEDEPLVQDFPTYPGRRLIAFYRRSAPYGFLSNLYDATCTVDGVRYSSSEHAYQAVKYTDPAMQAWILAAPKARHVAQAAHLFVGANESVRPDWDAIKFHRMKECLRAKFQDPGLKAQLLATGDAILVEAGETSWDVNGQANRTWGVPTDSKRGKNALGRLLMEVRGELGGTGSPLPDFTMEALATASPSATL